MDFQFKAENTNERCLGSHWCNCCSLISLFLLLSSVLLCTSMVLVLRPKKPILSLHAIHIESTKLGFHANKQIYIPPTIASLLFSMQNPNKIGIRYSSSEIDVWSNATRVGVIQVPSIYQPPRSKEISVMVHVRMDRLNVTRLLGSSVGSFRVLGCVGVALHVMNFHLPWIKFAVDCDVSTVQGMRFVYQELNVSKIPQALLSNLPHLSKNCSVSLCI